MKKQHLLPLVAVPLAAVALLWFAKDSVSQGAIDFKVSVWPRSWGSGMHIPDGAVYVKNLGNRRFRVKLVYVVSNSLSCPDDSPCQCGSGASGVLVEVDPNVQTLTGCELPNCGSLACDENHLCTTVTITSAEIVAYKTSPLGSWVDVSVPIECDPPLNPWRATGCAAGDTCTSPGTI